MRNSTGNADEKSTKTGQNDQTEGKTLEYVETKRKKQHKKNNNKTWGNKPESPEERRKIKEILAKGKPIQTKQDIPKHLGGDDTKTHQQPDARETEQFWTKIWQLKNLKKKLNG